MEQTADRGSPSRSSTAPLFRDARRLPAPAVPGKARPAAGRPGADGLPGRGGLPCAAQGVRRRPAGPRAGGPPARPSSRAARRGRILSRAAGRTGRRPGPGSRGRAARDRAAAKDRAAAEEASVGAGGASSRPEPGGVDDPPGDPPRNGRAR
ncbi:hypothetical protein QJS66_12135 [Kocuria rhizophila]|nr:hypothetical protein QJS66_12135 [Kocuria rhizophila]